jgi:hypothetical protein
MKKFTLFIVMFFSVYMNAQETKTLQNSLVKAKQEHKSKVDPQAAEIANQKRQP